MKTIKILMYGLMTLSLIACDKHDYFDDLVIVGQVGPQAYWEVESSVVTAGQQMGFDAQYYTSEKERTIDHSEVWYNLTEKLEKTVTCPWVTTFTYTITSTVSEEKRVSQKIAEYAHDDVGQWNDSLHAYAFHATFPVSGTLSPFAWVKPTTFDEEKMNTYFGENYMSEFKSDLYSKMSFADFKSMYTKMGLVEDFKIYTDSTFDVNSNAYVQHFPWNADSTATPVPDKIQELWNDSIKFADLIFNSSENAYSVEYKRSYSIRAVMRVYDDMGVYGLTVPKDIDIN